MSKDIIIFDKAQYTAEHIAIIIDTDQYSLSQLKERIEEIAADHFDSQKVTITEDLVDFDDVFKFFSDLEVPFTVESDDPDEPDYESVFIINKAYVW